MRKTAVATVTYYDLIKPDMEVRAGLALRTIEDALEKNCSVVVVDGGSTDSFVKRAKDLGAVVLAQKGKGIALGQQQGINHAFVEIEPDNYILIEPEKAGLLENYFEQIVTPIDTLEADIVLVGRTEESMHTITRIQRLTETKINEVLSRSLGVGADFCMAPRVWNKNSIPYFLNYTPTRNWDLFHGPVIDALKDKKRILPVRIPYVYPREMIEQEEGIEAYEKKRIDQLIEVTEFVRSYVAGKI